MAKRIPLDMLLDTFTVITDDETMLASYYDEVDDTDEDAPSRPRTLSIYWNDHGTEREIHAPFNQLIEVDENAHFTITYGGSVYGFTLYQRVVLEDYRGLFN